MPRGRTCKVPRGETCVPPPGRVSEVLRCRASEVACGCGCGCGLRRVRTCEQWRREKVKCRGSGFVCRHNKECVALQQQLSPRKELAAGSSRLECRGAGTDLAQGHASTGPMSRRVLPSLTGKLMGCSCWPNVAGHPGGVFVVVAVMSRQWWRPASAPFPRGRDRRCPAVSFIPSVAGLRCSSCRLASRHLGSKAHTPQPPPSP